MSNFVVSIDNCHLEPIHIPGHIQSHGFLVVIDYEGIITFVSENISKFLEIEALDLLAKNVIQLEQIIDYKYQSDFISNLLQFGRHESFEQTNPFEFKLRGFLFNLIISKSANYTILEFEVVTSTITLDLQNQMGKSIANMLGDKNLGNLLSNTARQIKTIIYFDRVLIYKFAEDGHGEVVAEAKNEDLASWIGLHYPASDIPQQARDLYKKNLTRLIANVEDAPSRIITWKTTEEHLDLTNAQLRAVSPIHIQYLKNMGVASSFSISLMYKGELWGLIACHNYSPRFIDFKARDSAKLIGQILSSALEFRQDEEDQHVTDSFSQSLDKLSKYLNQTDSIAEALTEKETNLLNIVQATGAILVQSHQISRLGITPDETQMHSLLQWIKENVTDSIFYTHNLSAVYPAAADYKEIASGIMLCVFSKELSEYIIWFKPEVRQTIKWAGDPSKPFEFNTTGNMQISPRHSFDLWLETVQANSRSWTLAELNSVKHLRDEIVFALNQKANAIRLMNEKLKIAYDELDTFSYTISHDLKNPIAIIKSYTQLLIRDQTIGDKGLDLLARIGKGADKMNSMITEVLDYSRIGRAEVNYASIDTRTMILDIVADLKVIYNEANLRITVGNTPEIQGEYRMIFQVFSNLIGNAVKYSQHAELAEVTIEGTASEQEICYCIKDNGIGIATGQHHKLFELFQRMDNVTNIEGSGVGLAIVKRIVDKHQGRIWVESESGHGSSFYIAFRTK